MTEEFAFRVEREPLGDEYLVDSIVVLVPEFQPSNLSARHRKFYDAFRESNTTFGAVIEKPPYIDAEVGEIVALSDVIESTARLLNDLMNTLRALTSAVNI